MGTAILEFQQLNIPKRVRKIPDTLVRETIAGVRYYYPCYRDIMKKTKTLEDVMADNTLQWMLKEQIGDRLKANLDLKKYRVGRGEVGLHLGPNENVVLDIAVFDRLALSDDKIGGRYAQVAPLLVVEIDINIELPDRTANLFEDYAMAKIARLLAFGVGRVMWIFTKSRTVFVAEPGKNWHFVPWGEEVELMNGVMLNVAEVLREEGIEI